MNNFYFKILSSFWGSLHSGRSGFIFCLFIVRYIGSPWPRGLACCRGYGRCGTGRHGNTRSWGLKSPAHPLPLPQWNSLPSGAEWRKMSTTSKWYLTSKKNKSKRAPCRGIGDCGARFSLLVNKSTANPREGGRCKGLCVICRPAKCPARLFLHAGGFRLHQKSRLRGFQKRRG